MKRILFLLLFLSWGYTYGQCGMSLVDSVYENSVTLITYNSARINGNTSNGDVGGNNVVLAYVRVGQVDTVYSSTPWPNALRNLTGLQASTAYVYYYFYSCGSGTIPQSVAYYFTTLANTIFYTPMTAAGYQFKYGKFDSGLAVPRGDTSLGRAPAIPSIVYKNSDNTYYAYHTDCSCWSPLSIDSSGIIALLDGKVDSVTVNGDSLFYWKVGVSYGYIMPGTVTIVLETITDFGSLAILSAKTVIVTDSIRGGTFLLYSGTDAADNGMIFTDGLAQKWKRVLTDKNINVRWYGARIATLYDYFDSRPAFMLTKDYTDMHHSQSYKFYIPGDTTGISEWSGAGRYFISDSIEFNLPTSILGDGNIGYPTSRLVFPVNKKGLIFRQIYGTSPISVNIENLYLEADADIPNYNLNSHAITSTVKIHIKNVECSNWGGDGLHFTSCASPPTGDNNNYGNASKSKVDGYRSTFCTNGIYIEGCDFSTSNFTGLDIAQQRRWGVMDKGFLGNSYNDLHFAFNGSPVISGANSVVTYNGEYYGARMGHDGYFGDAADSNYNKIPSNGSAYWYKIYQPQSAVAWNDSTRYYSGGTIAIGNINAWASIEQIYAECYQPKAQLNSRTKIDNDNDNCPGVIGNWHRMFEGSELIYAPGGVIIPNSNDSLWNGHLHIGESAFDPSAPFTVTSDASLPGGSITVAKFKTTGSVNAIMSLSTESGTYTTWHAQSGQSYWGSIAVGLDTTRISLQYDGVLFDPDGDGIVDLGLSGNAFGNIFAKVDAGVGTKDLRINPSTGKFTYADTTINTNLANTNLIQTANRDYDAAGYFLRFNNVGEFGVGSDSTILTSVSNHLHILPDSTRFNARVSYESNLNGTFTQHSLVDKNYVDSNIAAQGFITASSTNTLTNKRWTARVGSTTSSGTPTINTDNVDIYKLTAQSADITSFTTNLSGTPVDGDILEIQVTGTAARAITWGASFVASTVSLPTTTATTATLTTIFQYYTTSSYGNNKWVCVNYY